jgi:hypothetical protein
MSFAKDTFTLICDDFRKEVGNKSTIVGLYGKEMFFEDLPALLPKICFVVLGRGVKKTAEQITIKVKLPGSGEAILSSGTPPGLVEGGDFQMALVLSPFKVEKEGDVVFRIYLDDSKRASLTHTVKILKKTIPE